MTEVVIVQSPTVEIVQVSSGELLITETTDTETVEVGIAGPQGPTGPQGLPGEATVATGLLAARPPAGDAEGELYGATDTEELYIWFA
jgi:hypothetical protein